MTFPSPGITAMLEARRRDDAGSWQWDPYQSTGEMTSPFVPGDTGLAKTEMWEAVEEHNRQTDLPGPLEGESPSQTPTP